VIEIVAVVAVLVAVGVVIVSRGGGTKDDLGTNPTLARELLAMERADQKARNAAIKAGASVGESRKLGKEIGRVDKRNTARLGEIIDEVGWPGKSLVGERASQSAWLIAQHADMNLKFQKRALALMRAMPHGEVVAKNVAYLTDRVLVAEGKEQQYGTQFECRKGELVPRTPIADPENIDETRDSVGMEPLDEYKKSLEDVYGECPKGP
jgi:uncharacterized protein DUF6624